MKIHLLPGMGATSEMYSGLAVQSREVVLYDWPPELKFETFPELARYFLEHYSIQKEDILAGSSMGGMIACEMSRLSYKNDLLLLGSCTHPRAIPWHRLTHLGAHMVPFLISTAILIRGKNSLLARMVGQVGPEFIRRSLTALRKWEGVRPEELGSIRSIHGIWDPLILSFMEKHDEYLASGIHMIAITHSKRVSAFIDTAINGGLTDGRTNAP